MRRVRLQHGFTLVELLIVAVVLAVFASIVTSQLATVDDDSKISSANETVKAAQRKIDQYHALNGRYPTEIDVSWFNNFQHPKSPFAPDWAGNTININDSPDKWHPGYKTFGTWPPFWYCRGNGIFRIRVPEQDTNAETLALYNAANGTNAASLSSQTR